MGTPRGPKKQMGGWVCIGTPGMPRPPLSGLCPQKGPSGDSSAISFLATKENVSSILGSGNLLPDRDTSGQGYWKPAW